MISNGEFNMVCTQCGKEVDANITMEAFKEHNEICPLCEAKNNMECIDAEPVYDENNILMIPEGYICCYGCSLYMVSDNCYLIGKLNSPVKVKCSEYKEAFEED